jgi:hypothetical protein
VASNRTVVVHGHFYQPPRDDPWMERVPREPSAAPWHDWNERIERECYRAVTAARLQDPSGRITGIVNTLEWISFNVGPTLLEWMDRNAPATYRRILEADRTAVRRTGWGTAIAQPYHHAILPLASPRDRRTEIRWGIADFRRRFGRDPLGMWLPETAVDHATLDDLAAEGIVFTIVGDHQVERVPRGGRPGWVRTSGGRRIALFCYDGPISHDVAFGPLLRDAGAWERRLLADLEPDGQARHAATSVQAHDPAGRANPPARPESHGGGEAALAPASKAPDGEAFGPGEQPAPRELVLVATDGETFGHHHPFGEMALASLLHRLRRAPGTRVEPLAAALHRLPPREELLLRSPSAWSCAHGVERWRSDCGCRMTRGTQQEWRAPLRAGVEGVASALHRLFEEESRSLGVEDPWGLRDALGELVGLEAPAWRAGVDRLLPPRLPDPDRIRLRELLEMERDLLRSFTSCGWFFDDIGGIEGLQVLRYTSRALELAGTDARRRLEPVLLDRLAGAPSNDEARGNGADLYRREVLSATPAPARVAAGAAALAVVAPDAPTTPDLVAWSADVSAASQRDGAHRVRVLHRRTGRTAECEVSVRRPDAGQVMARVRAGETTESWELAVPELPEPQGAAVARALRRDLVMRWLTPADHHRLLSGDASLGRLAADRLILELDTLEGADVATVSAATPGLMALAELAELAEAHIPFDIQTSLHDLRQSLGGDARRAMEPLAILLGFAPESD